MNRLPAVALTRTDWGIYLRIAARLGMSIEQYMLEAFSADNRDADLMLILVQWRDIRSKPDAWHRALHYALSSRLR
jgi:hypothetical protein